MKTKILSIFLLVLISGITAFAQNADDILKKHFAATGMDKMKDLKTLSMTMKVNSGGMEMPMVTTIKKPNSILVEMSVQGQNMTIGFDGKKGWMVNPMMGSDPVEVPEAQVAQFKNQSNLDQFGFFADYKEKGTKAEYLGKENVNGKPAHKIKMVKKEGEPMTIFIDAASYMMVKRLMKTKMMDKEVEAEAFLSNFKKVDTYTMPHLMEVKSGDQPETKVVITKFEINKPVDDAKFKMPVK